MSLLPLTRSLCRSVATNYVKAGTFNILTTRHLMSKQLVYSEFGDPLEVVKMRDFEVPPLQCQEVLVRMLAAPVNPADINTIQGKNLNLPSLPCVPGDEGVGDVVEIGSHVCCVKPGARVVFSKRRLGTWRYYGIFDERDVQVISRKIPLAEASMITIAPFTAYRMIHDFRYVCSGQTIVQNGANSPCGQAVIQLCKQRGINTFNIVANHCGYNQVKEHLLSIGATAVHTLEEAEEICSFNTSLTRPVLGLNCLEGRFEDVMLQLIESGGTIVYYGGAFDCPLHKRFLRNDISFHKFHLSEWDAKCDPIQKSLMLSDIVQSVVIGQFRAPIHELVELKDYVQAFKNTSHSDTYTIKSYIFDFTC